MRTLILDGLTVTTELLHDIILDPSFSVRILSIREVKNLNESKLQQILRYACRTGRPDPENTPRLKALYVFGLRDSTLASEEQKQREKSDHVHNLIRPGHNKRVPKLAPADRIANGWYTRKGKMVTRRVTLGWGETLQKCAGLIAFDATLCTGPRHINSPAYGLNPYLRLSEHPLAVATIALGGCTRCGNAPEGLTNHSTRRSQQLPVLAPVPALASTLKAAQRPEGASTVGQATFVARCADCIRDRYCTACHQWWCETCYLDSKHMIAYEPVILDVDYDFGSFGMDNSVQTQLMSMGFEAPKPEVRICNMCQIIVREHFRTAADTGAEEVAADGARRGTEVAMSRVQCTWRRWDGLVE